MFFITVCVLLITILLIAYRKTIISFKLLSYDYQQDDSKCFFGTDEMAEAYRKQLEEAKSL